MARHWVKFNVFFETLDEDDEDALFDQIVDAVSDIIDPACSALDWEALGGIAPDGHSCTRTWTAASCTIPALDDDDPDVQFVEDDLDAMDEAMCSGCGRPFPDAQHRVEKFFIQKLS